MDFSIGRTNLVIQGDKDWDCIFFFKQWGRWGPDGIAQSKKANGRLFRNRIWRETLEKHADAQDLSPYRTQIHMDFAQERIN